MSPLWGSLKTAITLSIVYPNDVTKTHCETLKVSVRENSSQMKSANCHAENIEWNFAANLTKEYLKIILKFCYLIFFKLAFIFACQDHGQFLTSLLMVLLLHTLQVLLPHISPHWSDLSIKRTILRLNRYLICLLILYYFIKYWGEKW